MAESAKRWWSVDEQVAKLESGGVEVGERASFRELFRAVGYYRPPGYLNPFRESEPFLDDAGRTTIHILNRYRSSTSVEYAAASIDFDRCLRMVVLDGVERVEISYRMQIGSPAGPAIGIHPACIRPTRRCDQRRTKSLVT